MSREQIHARYESGYGRGEGADYRPWLEAHDVPSTGVTTRMLGRKTGRMHVLFSVIERNAFLAAQWLGEVVDIREQFPLWPLEETEAIAEELGVIHPRHPQGGSVVMTTDLLLTNVTGGHEAIAIKPSGKLCERRVLEKLEVERLYWKRRDVQWSIVTEQQLPELLIANLLWIDEYYEITPETLARRQIDHIETLLLDGLARDPDLPLNLVCAKVDDRLGVAPGSGLAVVRHLLARKRWRVPLSQKLDPCAPFPIPELAKTTIVELPTQAA